MPDVTSTLLAMYQQIIGGSSAREQSALEAECARRVILAGININPAGIVSFPNNVAFGGITVVNATVTGSLTVTGTFSVAGNLTAGSLTVTGAASVGGLLTASAGLVVSGNATMDSLTVNGPGTFVAALAGGSLAVTIQNTNATNGAEGTLNVGNDASNILFRIRSLSSGTTPAGLFQPNATVLAQGGAGGLTLAPNPGALKLATSGLERLRIAPTGEVLIGTPTAGLGQLAIVTDGTAHYGITIQNTSGANNINYLLFTNSAGANAGNITQSGATSVVYGTTSDGRLKEDDGLASDLTALRAVRVHDFVWKADGVRDRGIFAQEVAPLFPRAVIAGTDDTTERGDLKSPWMTDYSKFVPDLIVGWQQLDAEVAALRAALAAQAGS